MSSAERNPRSRTTASKATAKKVSGMPEVGIDLIPKWVKEYSIDGMLIHSSRTCRFWNLGQQAIIEEAEKRFGVPGLLMETDMIDPGSSPKPSWTPG